MAIGCKEREILNMPANCGVPNCTKKLYRTENGKKISYSKFPDDMNLKKRWLHAIRSDEGKEFSIFFTNFPKHMIYMRFIRLQ